MFSKSMSVYIRYANGKDDFFAFSYAPEVFPWLKGLVIGYSKNTDREFLNEIFPMYWRMYSETSDDCISGKIILAPNCEPTFTSLNETRVS